MELHLPFYLQSLNDIKEEHDKITATLDNHVQYLLKHSIITNLSEFVSNIKKPLRPYWICYEDFIKDKDNYVEKTSKKNGL